MAITDFLINTGGIERQKEKAIDFAKERYDPSVFNPQVDFARTRATEGISSGQEGLARERTIQSLFRPNDFSLYGGNQARAIAGGQQRSEQAQRGMAQFESNLTRQDIQSKQQGEQAFAEARGQQLQMVSQRDAAIEEAELQAEAEIERRKKQLASTVGKVAGTLAGTAFGPAGAALAGAAGGALGGGEGIVSGALSGATTAMQFDMMEQMQGGQEVAGEAGETLLDAGSDAGFGVKDLMKTIPENMAGVAPQRGLTGKVGDLPTPQTPTPSPQPTGGGQRVDLGSLGYDESGRPMGSEPQQQFDLTQLLDTPDYLKPLNMEGDGQQVRKPRLGERVFDDADYMRHLLGPVGEGAYNFGTFPFRKGLNVMEEFSTQYGRALEQGPPKGIFE